MFPCLGEGVVMVFGVGSVQTESRHLLGGVAAFVEECTIYLCVCVGYQCGPI